jgi:hypothetical protein
LLVFKERTRTYELFVCKCNNDEKTIIFVLSIPFQVNRFTTYIALFLLLLFTRAMVPDQLLLSLHKHAHTEHSHPGDHNQAHVEKKHNHCPVEELFEAPFQRVTEVFVFRAPSTVPVHTARYTDNPAYAPDAHIKLRGPPAVA